MFQWVVAGGACGCGQWTSRAAGERTWTACAARTTGGSTPCPASTPGDIRPSIVTVLFKVISVQDPPHRSLECPQRGSVLQNLLDHIWASEARQPAVPGKCPQSVWSLFVYSTQCLAFAYQWHYCLKCQNLSQSFRLLNQSFPVISLLHLSNSRWGRVLLWATNPWQNCRTISKQNKRPEKLPYHIMPCHL